MSRLPKHTGALYGGGDCAGGPVRVPKYSTGLTLFWFAIIFPFEGISGHKMCHAGKMLHRRATGVSIYFVTSVEKRSFL